MIEEAGRRAFPLAALVSRAGVAAAGRRRRAPRRSSRRKRIERVADVLVSRRVVDELKTALVEMLTAAPPRAAAVRGRAARRGAENGLFRRGHPRRVRARRRRPGAARERSPAAIGCRWRATTWRCRLARSRRARRSSRSSARGGLTPPDLAAIVCAAPAGVAPWPSASVHVLSSRSGSSGSTRCCFTRRRCSR